MKLSVIIPVHNREKLVGETLFSILNQSLPADEVIVVDDGSNDATLDVVLDVSTKWKNKNRKITTDIKVISQLNRGPGAARNAGLKASSGEYIHFYDSDDLAALNKHQVQLEALESSGADIAYCPWVKGKYVGYDFFSDNFVLQQYGLPQGSPIKSLLTTWSIVPHACLFRRSIVEMSDGFPEDISFGEDQLMFLKCLLEGARIVHTPGTLNFYRSGERLSITAPGKCQKKNAIDWAKYLCNADALCRTNGIDVRRWFLFRLRAWEAAEDLRLLGVNESELHHNLVEIQGGNIGLRYSISRALSRKWLGIKWRLSGNRSLKSFRSGPINTQQISLLKELGYSYRSLKS